jgi:hypothetical protein
MANLYYSLFLSCRKLKVPKGGWQWIKEEA